MTDEKPLGPGQFRVGPGQHEQIGKILGVSPETARKAGKRDWLGRRRVMVIEKQPDGREKVVLRAGFPGRKLAVSGGFWRQLWFRITGR
ncbi:MAG: hypothetical protein AAGI68_14490 [Planctomycetota bacterium]